MQGNSPIPVRHHAMQRKSIIQKQNIHQVIRLVDLNQARPSNRRLGHGFSVGERATAIDEGGDGETIEQVLGVGEGCLEGGDAILDVDV